MPIQHASDHVLQLMQRAERNDKLHALYSKIRDIRSDIILRTTVIVGHPGETDEDFEILKQFIKKNRFDRVGSFIYSDEEGTNSYTIKEKVSPDIARKRQSELMRLQGEISLENNRKIENSVQMVLIDSYDKKEKYYIGRTYRDAPEIDNEVIIRSDIEDKELIGTYQDVLITDSSEYELYGIFDV
jgi:ribosomal protein S12 methylthiotransferase